MTRDLSELGGASGVLELLITGHDLSVTEAEAVMDHVFDGEADPVLVGALLVAFRTKGETADELTGMVRSMLRHATPVELDRPAMDIVGTGGDNKHSVNVSTMAALVVAGAGVPVCKHGNRAASSSVGTADVLEELGVHIEGTPEIVARSVASAGIGFCFAPSFHPAMRHVGPVRPKLGVRTAFNLLGPLANPSRPRHLLVGTADPSSAEKMAAVLGANGIERAWVVYSADGYDELSLAAPNHVVEVDGDGAGAFEMASFLLEPAPLGLRHTSEAEIRGGDVTYNAAVVRALLAGQEGPVRDLVLLNAAAALVVVGRVLSLEEGLTEAARSIDEGRAAEALEGLVTATSEGATDIVR